MGRRECRPGCQRCFLGVGSAGRRGGSGAWQLLAGVEGAGLAVRASDSGRGRAGVSWAKEMWVGVSGGGGLGSQDSRGTSGCRRPRPGSADPPPSLQRGSVTVPWADGGWGGLTAGWAADREGSGRAAVRSGLSVLFSEALATGADASSQRPRPGHKDRDHSIPHHGPEGRQPRLGAFRPERPVGPPLSFLASAEGPQRDLLGTGVWGLLAGRTRGQAA